MSFQRKWWVCALGLWAACAPASEDASKPSAPPPRSALEAVAAPPAPWHAYMVRDLNSREQELLFGQLQYEYPGAAPLPSAENVLVFMGWDPLSSYELWRTDGTAAGTWLLKDIAPGFAASRPSSFIPAGDLLFFTAADELVSPEEDGNRELWRTDGTPEGTVKVKELFPGPAGSNPQPFLPSVGGKLLFLATTPEDGRELWATDGTEAGTVRLTDVLPGTGGFSGGSFSATLNGVAYGRLSPAGRDTELWRTDGTAAGTYRVKDICPGSCSSFARPLAAGNGQLFLFANDGSQGMELWRSDGTEAGTVLVKDIVPGAGSSAPLPSEPWTATMQWVNGTLFFTAYTEAHGVELWKSDGTEAGTVLVEDVWPGGSSEPLAFRELNGVLYFVATTGFEYREAEGIDYRDRELWRSDGTEAGTVRVKDIWPGVGGSFPESLLVRGSTLYFSAQEGWERGRELWKSDGTEAGTLVVKDLLPEAHRGSSPGGFHELGGRLLFFADRDGNVQTWEGMWLWTSDGTEAGTVPLWNLAPRHSPSSFRELTDVAGTLYFWSSQGEREVFRLWKSDGTRQGTVRVSEVLRPLAPDGNPNTSTPLTVLGGRVFTPGMRGNLEEAGLWASDGTAAGTFRVSPVEVSGRPVELGGALYFTGVEAGVSGLWRSDGTVAGTQRRVELGESAIRPVGPLGRAGGTFYFGMRGAGSELWKSDGTAQGTSRVRVLSLQTYASLPESFVDVRGTLFFVASADTVAPALWKSDGTEAGTVVVKTALRAQELVVLGGRVLFWLDDALWASDGTEAGTVRLTGPGLWGVGRPVVVGSLAFFPATDAEAGAELWKTDGTAGGTSRVKDAVPGPAGSRPRELLGLGEHLLFSAADAVSSHEPWLSDGTEAGTYRLADLAPGPVGSMPEGFREAGGRVFFSAAVDLRGRELWALTTTPDTVPPVLACPADVTVDAGNASEAPAHFAQATASDDRSEVSVSSSHASGGAFPVGTTEVVFTARDGAGNTSTCTLRVTVSSQAPADAGTGGPDAGTGGPDAGTGGPDAGTGGPQEPPPSEEGSSCGGCATGSAGPLLAWTALLLAGLGGRRGRA